MKKIFTLLALLLIMGSKAQVPNITETDPSTLYWDDIQLAYNMQELDQIRALYKMDEEYHLKIYIHVLRQSDGSGGQSVENINLMLQNLYNDFDPLGIYFVQDRYASINYIDNSSYYGNPSIYRQEIVENYSHNDGIDIFLGDDLIDPTGFSGGASSIEFTSVIMTGYILLDNDKYFSPVIRTRIVSNLFGRLLSLLPTHYGTPLLNTGGCPELVDGSNCNDCGDFICDTPADPSILVPTAPNIQNGCYNVDKITCQFTPICYPTNPPVDSNGDEYNPDATNIMSSTLPACMSTFTNGQKLRMKNYISFNPDYNNNLLEDYVYIRALSDCYACDINQQQERVFRVYSSWSLEQLYVLPSSNINVEVLEPVSGYFDVKVSSNLSAGQEGGETGYFNIVRSGVGGSPGLIEATQHLWVGLPETVPDATVSGTEETGAGQGVGHNVENRIAGIEFYRWELPEPNLVFWGGIPDPTTWQYWEYSNYYRFTSGNSGDQTGYVTVRGENPCGLGNNGFQNELCVVNTDDPEGDTSCDAPAPIYYYPNPSDSLLQIDLSLQDYKVFDVVIYDANQTAVYTGQSTNVVKTVDVAGLNNGSYYLHIYDSGTMLISAILIINH